MVHKFAFVKRKKEIGINWCCESRHYVLKRKWWHRFLKIQEWYDINPGNFYFPKDRKLLPQERTKEYGLDSFLGKEYIDWVLENTKGRVSLYCKREYGISEFGSINNCRLSLGFSDKNDIMLFKLRQR